MAPCCDQNPREAVDKLADVVRGDSDLLPFAIVVIHEPVVLEGFVRNGADVRVASNKLRDADTEGSLETPSWAVIVFVGGHTAYVVGGVSDTDEEAITCPTTI